MNTFKALYRNIINNPFFRLRYNALVLVQIVLNLINFIFIMKIFGVGIYADAYYVSLTIIGAVNLLQLLFIEQFIYFYHDVKTRDVDDAYKFYKTVFSFTFLTQCVLSFIVFILFEKIILLFTSDIDAERGGAILVYLQISIGSIFLYPLLTLNTNLFNAEMKFSLPYIIQIIPISSVSLTLFSFVFNFLDADIKYLACSSVVSMIISLFLQLYFVRKIGVKLKFSLYHPMLWSFLKNSFSMRFGHNMHGFFVKPLITRVLTSLPVGYASSFSYAEKILFIIQSVIVGPSLNIARSRISLYFAGEKFREIKQVIRDYLKLSLFMLVPAVLAAYIILPYALSFIAPDKISVEEITRIKYLFIALSAWYFLIAAESPFVLLVISARKSLLFIRTNTVCIIIIFSFCFLFKSYFGVFVLPLALFAGQVHNTVIYIKNALFIIESENNNGNNGVNIAV